MQPSPFAHSGLFKALALLSVLIFSITFLCQPSPYLLRYHGRLYLPFLQPIPATTFGHSLSIASDFSDPALQSHIAQHGWFLRSPIPYNQQTIDLSTPPLSPPSSAHWLGTDYAGRDVLALLLLGLRTTILFCLAYSLGSFFIGAILGTLSGYLNTNLDPFVSAVFLFWKSIPMLYLLILCRTFTIIDLPLLFCIMLAFGWGKFYYLTRIQALKVRQSTVILQSKTLGFSNYKILKDTLIPLCTSTSLTYLPWHFLHGLSAMTTAEVLGLCQFSTPSLSTLILQAKNQPQAYWISLSLFFTLSLLATCLMFLTQQHTFASKHHTSNPHANL